MTEIPKIFFQIDVMGIMSRLLGGQRIEDSRREEKNWVATIDRCDRLRSVRSYLRRKWFFRGN
jgi:hypothetical protein